MEAQKFSVESFRPLSNDVTAFVNPVTDLNGDACALLKIQGSPDFAFSTPLGIVKRVDKTGEVWLFVPKGSKKITLKHPQWGVIRDYEFPAKLESHISYELRINQPEESYASNLSLPTVTVRDTLLVVKTDTIVIPSQTPVRHTPFTADVLATFGISFQNGQPTFGLLATAGRRVGAFVHVSSDFRSEESTEGICGRYGETPSGLPFYSGNVSHANYSLHGGLAITAGKHIRLFGGAGYAKSSTAWQLAPEEGGGYLRNTYFSDKGISYEAGCTYTHRRVSASIYVATLKLHKWTAGFGIGIRLGKSARKEVNHED